MGVTADDLRAISAFAALNDDDVVRVGEVIRVRDYAPRSIIFEQGESSPGLWFVRRGRVRIFRVAPTGREFTLCIARADHLSCLGACPLFDGDSAPANAQALEFTTIYFLERERALEIAVRHRGLAKLLGQVLSHHYRNLTHLSSGLALHCSMPRLVELLLAYADRSGRVTEHGIELDLDVTQELLASVLGTTRQMLSNDLLRLERGGAIDAHGKRITIIDRERLVNLP